MAHHSRLHKVVVDAADPGHDAELAFWPAATGRTMRSSGQNPEFHGTALPGSGFGLLVQRLGDGPSRVHLDIHTDDLEAEVGRLERLGAARVRRVRDGLWFMQDPAGLPFCVILDQPGRLTADNAQRWN